MFLHDAALDAWATAAHALPAATGVSEAAAVYATMVQPQMQPRRCYHPVRRWLANRAQQRKLQAVVRAQVKISRLGNFFVEFYGILINLAQILYHILLDLLSFLQKFEYLFYGHYLVALKCLIRVVEQKFLGIHHFLFSSMEDGYILKTLRTVEFTCDC